ncbi:MAG: hypothetical protein RSA08_03275 [Clostridia bacterium]
MKKSKKISVIATSCKVFFTFALISTIIITYLGVYAYKDRSQVYELFVQMPTDLTEKQFIESFTEDGLLVKVVNGEYKVSNGLNFKLNDDAKFILISSNTSVKFDEMQNYLSNNKLTSSKYYKDEDGNKIAEKKRGLLKVVEKNDKVIKYMDFTKMQAKIFVAAGGSMIANSMAFFIFLFISSSTKYLEKKNKTKINKNENLE